MSIAENTAIAPLQFRDATAADVEALVALVESAYRGDASRVGWTTEADLLDGRRTGVDDVGECLAKANSRMRLAEREDANGRQQLLASANIAIEQTVEGTDLGYFGMFSVRPDQQGRGVGKMLLAECERIVRDEWRLPALRMTVIDLREELIRFYERRGYHRTGIHKPFPYGDERFGIPQRDDLRFEVLEKQFP